ncbi:MAG TPA: phage recombination protein Bet [Pseudolabrys sp.]|jgi:phage recombination protein Bet|nr:phage recombination protein Bet [Pseudolabrys sp.]
MSEAETIERPVTKARVSLVEKFADRYNIEPSKLLETLKATAFRQGNDRNGNPLPEVTNEQMAMLLIVADQYRLNPFTRELYAFPNKGGGIIPIVSVDGWARIVNEHPAFDGLEFNEAEKTVTHAGKQVPIWIECVIWRKDRSRATIIREYFDEVKRGTEPWGSHPTRMLRHKAFIQCVRIAFGFAGIYDPDEGERIAEMDNGVGIYAPDLTPRAKSGRRADDTVEAETRTATQPASQSEAPALTDDPSPTLPPMAIYEPEEEPVQVKPTVARGKRQAPQPDDAGNLFDAVEGQQEGSKKAPAPAKKPAPQPAETLMATEGEKAWVLGKLGALDHDPAEAIAAAGLACPPDLAGLSADGFIALKEYVRDIS